MWGISYSSNQGILILLAFIIWGSFIPSFEFIAFSPMISAESPTWAKVWWKINWGEDLQATALVEPQVNLLRVLLWPISEPSGSPGWPPENSQSNGGGAGRGLTGSSRALSILPQEQQLWFVQRWGLCVLGNGNIGEAEGKTFSLPFMYQSP